MLFQSSSIGYKAVNISTKIIAEFGINHLGNFAHTIEMVHKASIAGVWGIKFQYRNLLRIYNPGSKEVGDEILKENISRGALNSQEIEEAARLASDLGLCVGISFFSSLDVEDFSYDFDFYKVPSAELNNHSLVSALVATGKDVLVSTGMHEEREIELFAEEFSGKPNVVLLHCVSNYPVRAENATLGYLSWIREKFNFRYGYSSHDELWEVCVFALDFDIEFLERHVTLDKSLPGTDQSSSSSFEELSRLQILAEQREAMRGGKRPRTPNQGEKFNRQNLGRTFFAKRNLAAGVILSRHDFNYLSPQVGIDALKFSAYENKPLLSPVLEGEPLLETHLVLQESRPREADLISAVRNSIALPARLHDLDSLRAILPIGAYEFHLSFQEVKELPNFTGFQKDERYSIHLPDYIGPDSLFDPFSDDPEVAAESRRMHNAVFSFADRIGERTGQRVVVVASIGNSKLSRPDFYEEVASWLSGFKNRYAQPSLQWMPPFAWYFGGSVRLSLVNAVEDIDFIQEHGIPITLDTSHLFMGEISGAYEAKALLTSLQNQVVHFHLSSAQGPDGEGGGFRASSKPQADLLRHILADPLFQSHLKVIEVWQGHLYRYLGFRTAIKEIAEM